MKNTLTRIPLRPRPDAALRQWSSPLSKTLSKPQPSARQQGYGIWLKILLAFFVFRVVAQIVQALFATPWLPPFSAWQSGLLPYPVLVAGQLLIILFLGRTAWAFGHRVIVARHQTGRRLIVLGSVYALAMLVRYVVRMSLFPQERWAGGCLPIFFHLILASFLLVWGSYHWRQDKPCADC